MNPKILKNIPLRLHSTWKIGGRAQMFSVPKDIDELVSLLSLARRKKLKTLVIGNGSNMLFPDKGVRGLVIKLANGLNGIKIDGTCVTAGAGTMISALANRTASRGLGGLEFAIGIPATVGGAVVMNMGAWGREIADVVSRVKVICKDLSVIDLPAKMIKFGYRKSSLHKYTVAEVTFKLRKMNKSALMARMRKILEKRKSSQPLGIPNAGCVFRNPANDSAGRLIDKAGLRGKRVGDAQISTKHANFIVNLGNASASDIKALIKKARSAVKKRFGVSLSPEIKMVS